MSWFNMFSSIPLAETTLLANATDVSTNNKIVIVFFIEII